MTDHDFGPFNVDLTDYWLILRKRSAHVLIVFLIVFTGVTAYTLRLPPEYEAEAKIRIASRQPMATIEGAQINWYGVRGNELESEITLIANKEEFLVATLDILRRRAKSTPFTNPDEQWFYQDVRDLLFTGSFSEEEERALRRMSPADLTPRIESLPQSNIVAIRIRGPHPELIKAAANALAAVYRADYSRSRTQEARETMEFIGSQLERINRDFAAQREAGQKVAEEHVFLGSSRLYQDELTRVRIELERLSERYQDRHPRIAKQKQLIAKLEAQLARFPKTRQEHAEIQAVQEQQLALIRTLGEMHLKAKIDYEAKRLKAKDEVMVISRAESARKLRPNVLANCLAGAIFGLILGCFSAFVWEGLDTSIGKIEDVERVTRLPVIAHVPILDGMRRSRMSALLCGAWRRFRLVLSSLTPLPPPATPSTLENRILFNYDPMSVPAEAYRTLRTNIQFSLPAGQSGHVIAITSASPREGKTLTSTNLAIALAQMGKRALLLEADLRRPQVARLFRIAESPGLSDLLIGTAKVDQAVRTLSDILLGNSEWERLLDTQGIDQLHLLPCGTVPPNPTELLLSNDFRQLIAELRQRYDFVIIDTPPTLPVSDSSIISTVADGTVLIYQSDTTSRHLLLRAIQTLKKNQAHLLGIVINQLSFDVVLQSHGKYGYYYSYSHSEPSAKSARA